MGVVQWGPAVCPVCKKKVMEMQVLEGNLGLVCNDCLKELGGTDFIEAIRDLNSVFPGADSGRSS